MYEKYGFSARLAYNWRDEYLIKTNHQGTNRNPYYVEAYDQLDLSVNYRYHGGLSLGFEVINLTGEDIRWHGRSDQQLMVIEEPALHDRGPVQVLRAGSLLQERAAASSGPFFYRAPTS